MTPAEKATLVQHLKICDAVEYAVMRVLIDIMGSDLRAYITNQQVQDTIYTSRRTVQRATKRLCERGVISQFDGGFDLCSFVRGTRGEQ